jgi:phosphomevalonate kinase
MVLLVFSSLPITKNKFVELALHRTLTVAAESKGVDHVRQALSEGLDIAILGGNDFYSQRAQLKERNLPPTLESLHQLTPFGETGVTIDRVHKTGMGSSAALITSLIGGLLVHLQVVSKEDLSSPNDTEGRKLAHNVAQYVHCLAQGKIGSGFDVASAIFGSHVYTRFDPAVLEPIMQDTV